MSTTTYSLNASVNNATGGTITYWVKHKPQSTSSHDDWGYGAGLGDAEILQNGSKLGSNSFNQDGAGRST